MNDIDMSNDIAFYSQLQAADNQMFGGCDEASEEENSAFDDDSPDDALGWAAQKGCFYGNPAEIDRNSDMSLQELDSVFDGNAPAEDADFDLNSEISDNVLDWAAEKSCFDGDGAVADTALTISCQELDAVLKTPCSRQPSKEKPVEKQKVVPPKAEKKKASLPFEKPITPIDLFFLNDKPYVLDENHPSLYRCLDNISNLIAWIRKRLTKAAQLEVDSGKLRAHAQILSEHPDYRMETDPFCKKDSVILMQNGVVDLSGDIPILREPYIDEKFDWMVQADFIPAINCPSLEGTAFEHFCNTSLDGTPQSNQLLLEIIGYSISNTIKGKSFFILIGERDCGKSVIINFLGELFPPEQVTSFTLNQIADDRNTQQLCYGRLNISAENDEKSIKSVHIIKACTGGDRISAGRRYHDNVTIRPCVHFVFAVNRMPDNQSSDTSDAFYRRMRPLIFPYSIPFERQDPYLLDKLLEERNLIVTSGIWALHRVMHNTSSNYPFTVPESSRRFMQEYRENANSVLTFIQDCLVFAPEQKEYSENFNKAYKTYCDRNGLEKMSMKLLISQIKQHGLKVEPFRQQENGVLRRGLRGVGFMK